MTALVGFAKMIAEGSTMRVKNGWLNRAGFTAKVL
jgi:hypothetical protein